MNIRRGINQKETTKRTSGGFSGGPLSTSSIGCSPRGGGKGGGRGGGVGVGVRMEQEDDDAAATTAASSSSEGEDENDCWALVLFYSPMETQRALDAFEYGVQMTVEGASSFQMTARRWMSRQVPQEDFIDTLPMAKCIELANYLFGPLGWSHRICSYAKLDQNMYKKLKAAGVTHKSEDSGRQVATILMSAAERAEAAAAAAEAAAAAARDGTAQKLLQQQQQKQLSKDLNPSILPMDPRDYVNSQIAQIALSIHNNRHGHSHVEPGAGRLALPNMNDDDQGLAEGQNLVVCATAAGYARHGENGMGVRGLTRARKLAISKAIRLAFSEVVVFRCKQDDESERALTTLVFTRNAKPRRQDDEIDNEEISNDQVLQKLCG